MSLIEYHLIGGRQIEEDDEGNASCSRIYLAKYSTKTLSEIQALALLPATLSVGAVHFDDPRLFVSRRSAVQDPAPSAWWWTITISYSNERASATDNPLEVPADVWVDTLIEEKEVFRDRHGNAIVNKAGDPIEGVKGKFYYAEFTIIKNIWPLPTWLLYIQGRINGADYRIYPTGDPVGFLIPAEQSRFEYFKPGRPKRLNGQPYFEAEAKIIARGERMVEKVLNRGFRSREFGPDSFPMPIPGLSEPALLDNDGKWIKKPDPEDAVFIDVELSDLFDPAVLNIFS